MELRTRRDALRAAVAALALVLAGCAAGGATGADGEAAPDRVTVVVENNNWQDATVYVIGSGPRVRLGEVTSMTSKRFRVPRAALSPEGLRLEVDLLGSRVREVTSRILVSPGEEVRWTLENALSLSSYQVR